MGFGVQSCKCWGLHGLSKLCLNSKELIRKYGDISANSSLNPRTETRLLNIFCGVAYSMCNTKVTTNLLFYWWKHFKLVHHAGFNIQFAFDNLYRLVQSWFRLYQEFQTDKILFSYHAQISDLATELEEIKVEQKQHAASKKGKSLPEKECLIADMELILNTPRTFFL